MRFVVVGAGAVGGVVGGRLHQHGHDVVLVARGEHGRAIAEGGLRIASPAEVVTVRPRVVAHPAEVGFRDDDVVLLAVKTQDGVAALDAVAEAAPPTVTVACLQNGVEGERLALRRFADVQAVCVMLPATHLEPGRVIAGCAPITGLLDIGSYPAGTGPRTAAISEAFCGATFDSVPRPDIMRWKYAKLLMNLANAAEAVCGPAARTSELPRLARREGVACLRAAGIEAATREEDEARRGDLLQGGPVEGRERGGGSSWQSLQRGAGSIETDYLSGEIVLLGRLHGVPTPVNALLQRLAAHAAATGLRPGSMTVDEVMALLPSSA